MSEQKLTQKARKLKVCNVDRNVVYHWNGTRIRSLNWYGIIIYTYLHLVDIPAYAIFTSTFL
jgi:hypothetical protein